jgi:hypothetical protein
VQVANNTAPTATQASSITELLDRIRDAHRAVVGAANDTLTRAFDAGDLLHELKDRAGHGHWRRYLQGCGISKSTAANYMQLART